MSKSRATQYRVVYQTASRQQVGTPLASREAAIFSANFVRAMVEWNMQPLGIWRIIPKGDPA